MASFWEAMWGPLQAVVSELDFDYRAYAAEHFAHVHESAADPRFEGWLAGGGSAGGAGPRAGRDDRRGGGRRVDRPSPRRAGGARRRPAGPQRADERVDVPLRRACRPAAVVGPAHEDDVALDPPLPGAGGGVRVDRG